MTEIDQEREETYTVEQIRAVFAKHASPDSWSVPAFYEDGLIDALRGKYDDDVADRCEHGSVRYERQECVSCGGQVGYCCLCNAEMCACNPEFWPLNAPGTSGPEVTE